MMIIIVQQISEDLWANRAFDDTSVKFGTHGEDTLRKIFGYRAIAHFARNKNGGFLKMAATQYHFNGSSG